MLISSPSAPATQVRDEAGAILIIFSLFISMTILICSFALDVGNWFEHQRHLQLQADAAAFAAASKFAFGCTPKLEEEIYGTAGQYGGATSVIKPAKTGIATSTAPLYNEQVGSTEQSNIHEEINNKAFYKQELQGHPSETTTVEEAPCQPNAGMVDVKMTETNLPWFFKAADVSDINAHARVSVLQESSASGVSPLAVAETAPLAMRAYFVNEDETATLASDRPFAESLLKQESNTREWRSTEAVPVAINKTSGNAAHIGVVVALSGEPKYPEKSAATLSEKCSEPFVKCFDDGATGPLLHIAGYSNEGTGTVTAPLAREVRLSAPKPKDTCTDGYFSDASASCTFTISALLSYGSPKTKGVTVKPKVKGATGVALTAPANAETEPWTGTATLTAGSGSNEIALLVECKHEEGSPCASTTAAVEIKDVQRIYAASTADAGPISGAYVSEPGGTNPVPGKEDADAYEVCEGTHTGSKCTPHLSITIDAEPSLADAADCEEKAACEANHAGYYNQLTHLKFKGNSGEIDECVPGENGGTSEYRAHLAEGCPDKYKLNELNSEGAFSDPECKSANPYDCITIGLPGNHNGARFGVHERFETKPPSGTRFYCHNEWQLQNSKNGDVPALPSNDSRIVQVFVLPYGAINEEGEPTSSSGAAPIIHLASFYVTGFSEDGCALTTKEKEEGFEPDATAESFEIVGHFIKYVALLGETNGEKCRTEATAIETCVPILTE